MSFETKRNGWQAAQACELGRLGPGGMGWMMFFFVSAAALWLPRSYRIVSYLILSYPLPSLGTSFAGFAICILELNLMALSAEGELSGIRSTWALVSEGVRECEREDDEEEGKTRAPDGQWQWQGSGSRGFPVACRRLASIGEGGRVGAAAPRAWRRLRAADDNPPQPQNDPPSLSGQALVCFLATWVVLKVLVSRYCNLCRAGGLLLYLYLCLCMCLGGEGRF